MRYHEILKEFELTKNSWESLTSPDSKTELGPELVSLVRHAYERTSQGSFVNSLKDVLPSDWLALDWDKDPDVDVCIFYRTARPNENWTGYKIQGIGHNGQQSSKKHLMSKLRELLATPSWWIEASDALQKSLLAAGVKPITDEDFLKQLFSDDDLHMVSTVSYKRKIKNLFLEETVFGIPKLK